MKTLFSLALVTCLAACSSAGPIKELTVIDRPVPVLEKPIAAADVPAVPAQLPARPADAGAAADLLLAKVCEFVSYAQLANPLLRLSAGLAPGEALIFPECDAAR